jgi:hypothetical protein
VPDTITSDRGPQFTSSLTFNTNKEQLITLSQGRTSRTRRRGNIVQGATLCTPRNQSTAEGRHWSFFC